MRHPSSEGGEEPDLEAPVEWRLRDINFAVHGVPQGGPTDPNALTDEQVPRKADCFRSSACGGLMHFLLFSLLCYWVRWSLLLAPLLFFSL